MKVRTEFNFVLPNGMTLEDGTEKKIQGTMKLLKVKDIIDIYLDSRVKVNSSYFYIIVLCKSVIRLDDAKMVSPKMIENLTPENFAFLVDLFNEVNHKLISSVPVECSNCHNKYFAEMVIAGEL